MALPASGTISLSQVNVELSKASNAAISMNDSAVRTLFGKASGAISMSDGYGKSTFSGSILITDMSEYGSINPGYMTGDFPSNWNNNAYWAVLNSDPSEEESSWCQGYPTFSYDICLGDWGGILSGVSANAAFGSLTKVEFYDASGVLRHTVLKSALVSYYSSFLEQTAYRFPSVPSNLYYTVSGYTNPVPFNSSFVRSKMHWYFST